MKASSLFIRLLIGICCLHFVPETMAQGISGYTSIDYDEASNVVTAYSETFIDLDLLGHYDAYVSLSVNDQNGTNMASGYQRTYGASYAFVTRSFTASPDSTYYAGGYHKAYLNLYDYDDFYPNETFYFDSWWLGFFEGQMISEPWYHFFMSPGYQEVYRRNRTVSLGSTYDYASLTVAGPRPVNFHQVVGEVREGGRLHFEYEWESSTGNTSDLNNCIVQEVVTYQGGNPFEVPSPPFSWQPLDNPFYGMLHNGTDGGLEDNNIPFNFVKPYRAATVRATQRFRYKCGTGRINNFPGSYAITRSISQNANGSWKYTITKAGLTAEKNPLD